MYLESDKIISGDDADRIAKDKIGDTSVRLQFSQDEAWTRALKYLLIDVKWLLAFVSGRRT